MDKNNKKLVGDKNMKLAMEFNRFILEHPEITDQLPKKATIIFLPQNDPELCEVNKKIAEKRIKAGDQVVLIRIKNIRYQFEGLSIQTSPRTEKELLFV